MNPDPVDAAALAFFRLPEGQRLLNMASESADTAGLLRLQQQLRAEFPPAICRAALATVELRLHAREKFSQASQMYFDREGLEMATREEVANYRATRFAGCDSVVDLCCGIGGDTVALATHSRVIAVDTAPLRLEMARMNAVALGIDADRIVFVRADADGFLARADAAFIDPARRRDGRRVRAAEAYSPPLSSLEQLRRTIPLVVVKLAPGIRDSDLPADAEVEFISSARQCREALVSFPPLAPSLARSPVRSPVRARRIATVLPGPHCLAETLPASPPAAVEAPGAYMHDPDAAVVRAGLVDRLATHLDAWRVDARSAYLTSDGGTPSPFAQVFRVMWEMPFNLKSLKQKLSLQGLRAEEIKKRHFPIEPDDLRRLLRVKGKSESNHGAGRPITLILTQIAQRPHAFVCERVRV